MSLPVDARAQLQSALGDGYTIERELGGGGMSRVYLVEETRLRRKVVVKVLPPELAADVSVMRFSREISAAARLQHPHIVPLLATGETQGLPFYTMPFVEGESLRERLTRDGELPVVESVRLLREIASALAYAHEKGLVHRDIKPENILLSGGIALVADFGVAKALLASTAAGDERLTTAGIAIGTPAYMSPEQAAGDPSVDHRADIYALGMVAYEMLTGRAPFSGRPPMALLAAHITESPEPIERRRAAIPPALAQVVMRCLEKRPADRPQHATDIVQALDALSLSQSVSGAADALRSRGASRRVFAGGAAAVVALAVIGAWWVLGHRRAPAPDSQRILIAPFENLTGDRQFDYVGRLAADGLAIGLGQSGAVDVVPSNMVLMALRDTTGTTVAKRVVELSTATNAGQLVSGTITRRGDSLTLQAQVTNVRTNKVFATIDPTSGLASDPVSIVTRLGDRLLGALRGREIAILPQGSRPPTSVAYQEFAKGFERFAVYGDLIGARPYFERAIQLDSTFVRAYGLLARQYINAGELDRADSILRRVEKLPQGMNAVDRLQIDYNVAELRGDIGTLLRTQQELAARDSSPLALALIGEAAVWLVQPKLAIPAYERALPAFLLIGGGAAGRQIKMLAEAYHIGNEHDREIRVLQANRALLVDLGDFRARELRAYAGGRKKDLALLLADSMLTTATDSSGLTIMRLINGAQEFRAHGDTATASRLLARDRAWVAAHPMRPMSVGRQMAEGILFLLTGAPDSAIARFTPVTRDTMRLDAAGYRGLAIAARGDHARARAIADSLGAIARPWVRGNQTFWRAAIVGALGDRALAVQLLEQANREGQSVREGESMHLWHFWPALNSLWGYGPFDALVRAPR